MIFNELLKEYGLFNQKRRISFYKLVSKEKYFGSIQNSSFLSWHVESLSFALTF